MADTTTIEWTDRTWNPVTGCAKVSPGCDSCYAMTFAERWRGTPGHYFENGFDLQLRPDKVIQPLRWKKPRKVFVNSMSDLFHKDVPDEFIVKVFAIMALTPQHTYQLLTKRHARMRSVLQDVCKCGGGHVPGAEFRSAMAWAVSKANPDRIPGLPDDAEHRVHFDTPWPLPNVHVGVSVENQQWADIRIPALIDTPAAVRFLSCEPLLGPIDLTKWMQPISPVSASQAPRTWAEWTWPDWVPQVVRDHIEGFWGSDQGRGPAHWINDMHQQGAPAFGATLRMDDGFSNDPRQIVGRYVHAWNNIGRLVLADDPNRSFAYTSFGSKTRRRQQPINWVIVGGESGHDARPMHPDWARSLRDQSVAADIPFLFKQWGGWAPSGDLVIRNRPERGSVLVGEPVDDLGHRVELRRIGKKAAGRELDGRTWDQYPESH